jgi:hypothetical protein
VKRQFLILILVGSLSLECGPDVSGTSLWRSSPTQKWSNVPNEVSTAGGSRWVAGEFAVQEPAQQPRIEKTYDSEKDKTTVRLTPFKISGEKAQYISLHGSPSFSYPGTMLVRPALIDFELQTVVRGRLRTDLYVLFVIDGEKVFMSSSRWAVKRPIPGRVWVGERLVFRMPYETLMKMAAAKSVQIKMDAVVFELGESQLQAIRDFAKQVN